MEQRKNRISSLSYLRIAATVGVILMHVCTTLLDNPDLFALAGAERLVLRSISSCMVWCVPCFLMITGALFLAGKAPMGIRECLAGNVRRLVLALLVFGYPFALMMEVYTARSLSPAMLWSAFLKVLTNQSLAHLWYIYMLIGLFLLLPAIQVFFRNCSDELLKYVLLVLFAFNCALPVVSQLTNLDIAFGLPVTSCYLFYLLAGGYLARVRPRWAQSMPVAAVGIIACAAVTVAVCALPGEERFVAAYHTPLTAVFALCVFNLFGKVRRPVTPFSWALDRVTFGVYLIHPLFIHLLYRVLGITPTGALFPAKLLLIWLGVTAASFAGSWLLRKLPPLKRYVL